MPGRCLLVGNPTAQSGKARQSLERASDGLRARGHDVTFVATEPAGRTVEVVRRAIDDTKPALVVYLGGDGTFNEVARGILASSARVPLGMLPMGTANDQGRSFGIRPGPDAIDENLDVIVRGHVTELDAGRIEALSATDDAVLRETLFFDSAGWGMQPEILATRNRDRAAVSQIPLVRDLYRDQAVYLGAAIDRFLTSFVEPATFDAMVVADGGRHDYEGLTDLIVSGTAVYAGEWVLDRDSEPDDGRFELAPIQGRRDWLAKSLRDLAFVPVAGDELDMLGVACSAGLSASRLEVRLFSHGTQPVRSQVDGEEWARAERYRVTVLPRALPLVTREGFVPPWRTPR
ncbi:MAG: hypothetical protein IT379_17940 [Deltaproteobacteria bacterium]|nr:hypothetical protein [Deltaproteobacteria bacterium]